jgi:phosphoglycerate kinase
VAFWKKTIHEYDLNGKKVLLRADYNVPLDEDGNITDDYRLQQSLPTLKYLLEQNCAVIICSHLGRPTGPADLNTSLEPVAKLLSKMLDRPVKFVGNCVGKKAQEESQKLENGQLVLLENLRHHKEEEANDEEFAKKLASLAEVFVQDGFGVVHRAHASTEAVTRYLPSISGLLLATEVGTINEVMDNPQRPLMAIIGGAKISDKIDILNRFLDIADFVAVGGAMANTFLLAEGIDVAKSMVDKDDVPLAKEIIEKAKQKSKSQRFIFYLPQDGVVTNKIDKSAKTRIVDWDAHVIADIENYPNRSPRRNMTIDDDEMILDIGPFSGAFIAGGMQLANTVIWNGAMGVTETPSLHGPIGPFAHGTELIVDAMLGEYGHKPFTLVGGGDTVGYIQDREIIESFNHVSTGGGASMELMSGKSLPGVEALMDKDQ